ncbi:MAG: hypothetical protein GY937_01460 [bacterium]|nr:hypothetical protein [bacterium]
MEFEEGEVISALVVLRSAGGRSPLDESEITSANVRDVAPSEESAAAAAEAFRELGFEVGEVVGIGFSISASPGVFRKVFRTSPRRAADGGVVAEGGDDAGRELAVEALPAELARHVAAVTFEAPAQLLP